MGNGLATHTHKHASHLTLAKTAGHSGGHAHILIGESDSLEEVLQLGDGTVCLHHPLEDLRDLGHSPLSWHHQVFLRRQDGWSVCVAQDKINAGKDRGTISSATVS